MDTLIRFNLLVIAFSLLLIGRIQPDRTVPMQESLKIPVLLSKQFTLNISEVDGLALNDFLNLHTYRWKGLSI